jgi:hypothetical protein
VSVGGLFKPLLLGIVGWNTPNASRSPISTSSHPGCYWPDLNDAGYLFVHQTPRVDNVSIRSYLIIYAVRAVRSTSLCSQW